MKRVLVVIPNLDLGGTEVVVMNYFRHMRGVVFDFVVHGTAGFFEEEARRLGARIFRVPTRGAGFFGNVRAMRRIYRENSYDTVVICTEHSFAFIEAAVAWAAGVKNRAAWSHFSDYQGGSRLRRVLHFLARPWLRLFANVRLACSEDAARWLFGGRGLRKKNIHIINNAIDLKKFAFCAESRAEYRGKLELADGEFAVGIVGRLAAVKNHGFALEVFEKLTAAGENSAGDARLVIIGDGELRTELEAEAARRGISSRVIFTGAVEEIAGYYHALDALIMPSFHEGFGLAAVEAQAAGLNVFISDTVPREVGISPLAHFVSLRDGTEAWAAAILSAATAPQSFNRGAINFSDSGFNITREAGKLEEILTAQ